MTTVERFFAVMMKPWVGLLYLCLLVVSYVYWDQSIAYYFHELDVGAKFPVIKLITLFGLGGVCMLPPLILALYCRFMAHNKNWEVKFWFLFLSTFIPSMLCLVFKTLFGRARPSMLFNEHIYGFFGFKTQAAYWSCPSGHTSSIMGLVFGLSLLFPRYFYAFILTGLIVATSRIMLTNHYLSDVLTAAYLALVEVGILVWWLKRKALLIYADDSHNSAKLGG